MSENVDKLERRYLKTLKNSNQFDTIFKKFVKNEFIIDEGEQEYLLLISIVFFNYYKSDKRFKSYFKIAYYIVLKYSQFYKNFLPIYDISLQLGFFPISNYLIKHNLVVQNGIQELIVNNSVSVNFLSTEKYIETIEQSKITKNILNNESQFLAFIAPTSYGKSSLIKEFLKTKNIDKIGIIVPTKSLLIQTFRLIKDLKLNRKIIIHDEMYDNNKNFIAILTQERALRLITKNEVYFDMLFIDEAHSLYRRDSRSILLARLIELSFSKNNKTKIMYLSPLIDDVNNLELKINSKAKIYSAYIENDMKTFDTYLFDNGNKYVYDRFTDQTHLLENGNNYFEYILKNSNKKNFIYNYRPKKIELLALEIANYLPDITDNEEIDKIISTLKEEVHTSFYNVNLLKKGVVYIHGKIPNQIKEYLEYSFKNCNSIKYIIANSVILEGVNLPIDSIFITSSFGLEGKSLLNLIGRVNRLNYVFGENNDFNDLSGLLTNVHFLNSNEYQGRHDIKNKMKLLRDYKFKDELKNPILSNYDILKSGISRKEINKIRLIDLDIINKTQVILNNDKNIDILGILKKRIIEASIDDFYFDIDLAVSQINSNINNINSLKTDSELVDIIKNIFIEGHGHNLKDFEIERLNNPSARNYYNNYINLFQKKSLNEKINSTYAYFFQKSKSEDSKLYIGNSYGEISWRSNKYSNINNFHKVYIDLKYKSKDELINLSIIKLKIEDDFVSYKLNKLIVFLYDTKIINEDVYHTIIYGSTNKDYIALTKLGLNIYLINKLSSDNQIKNIKIDENGNLLPNTAFIKYLETQSDLFKFEINKYYL